MDRSRTASPDTRRRWSQRWLIAGAIAGSLHSASLFAQPDVLTPSTGGPGGRPFTISCSDGLVLIGVRFTAGWYVRSLQGLCSNFRANGIITTDSPLPTDEAGSFGGPYQTHDVICPEDQALVRVTGREGDLIDQLFISCAPLRFDGLRRLDPELVPSEPFSSSGGGLPFTLTCPDRKVARALTGTRGNYIDRLALVCNVAPVWTTGMKSVTLRPRAVQSGIPIEGRATVNGSFYEFPLIVFLGCCREGGLARGFLPLPGTSVPDSVLMDRDSLTVAFQMSSTPDVAGCVSVSALVGDIAGRRGLPIITSNEVVLTPQPPAAANFRFQLQDPPANLTYIAPGTIAARIRFGTGRRLVFAEASGEVTFTTSNPVAVSVPEVVSYGRFDTGVDVELGALGPGCSVITATLSGVSVRRTIRTVLIGG